MSNETKDSGLSQQMKRSTKYLVGILAAGLLYSFGRLFSGKNGSGPEYFFEGLVYSSIALFLASLGVLVFNRRKYKQHRDTIVFLLMGLPLTMLAAGGQIVQAYYDRTPDLSVKYRLPVDREQYLFDSTNIKVAIDTMIAFQNRKHGQRISYAVIDTIIYSQTGDKIFVSYIKKFEPNEWWNDFYPDYLVADSKDSIFWRLSTVRYAMGGSFQSEAELKLESRKFYFNRFSFLDEDSTSESYFWNVVLGKNQSEF